LTFKYVNLIVITTSLSNRNYKMSNKKVKKNKSDKIDIDEKEVYVIVCTFFERSNYNTHMYIMKNKKAADEKVEELHDEHCDKDLYDGTHTYDEHCNMKRHSEDETNLSIDIKKHKLLLSSDEIISVSSYS
jgi:predicted nucleotidyltransferase component of viral defense system